jgi:hypothetical protein
MCVRIVIWSGDNNMLLKDKLIIVVYIGVEDCNMIRANERVNIVRNHFESMRDESVEFIFVPDFESCSCRVETINPKRISDEEYEKVSEIVEDYKKSLKKL